MTRREAMRRALRHAADAIEGEIDNGSGWIGEDDEGELMSEADVERMEWAVREIADSMRRRAEGRERKVEEEPVEPVPCAWCGLRKDEHTGRSRHDGGPGVCPGTSTSFYTPKRAERKGG